MPSSRSRGFAATVVSIRTATCPAGSPLRKGLGSTPRGATPVASPSTPSFMGSPVASGDRGGSFLGSAENRLVGPIRLRGRSISARRTDSSLSGRSLADDAGRIPRARISTAPTVTAGGTGSGTSESQNEGSGFLVSEECGPSRWLVAVGALNTPREFGHRWIAARGAPVGHAMRAVRRMPQGPSDGGRLCPETR